MRNFDNYVPDELRVWLKLNGESINYVCKAPLNGTIKINTEKHKYLYYPDRDELLIEIKKEITEYEPVLYPNRAVETRFEGM